VESAHRLWKTRLIPRGGDPVIPSVILSPRSFDPVDVGETNPYIAEVLLKLFAGDADVVLDPFCGSGTICSAASRLGKTCLCVDLRIPPAAEAATQGDAVLLPLRSGSVDAVVTSPPYFGAVKYSWRGLFESGDLGDYIMAANLFSAECARVLRPGGTAVVRVGDSYVDGTLVPTHVYWLDSFLSKGFALKHILVYVYWDSAYVEGGVKKVHDYVLVLKKREM